MGNSALARGPEDRFVPGDWNIYCSICDTKLKFGEAVRNWQGMWRHVKCNEERPPQDFVHSINSREMTIPVAQKDTDLNYIAPPFPASGVAVTNTFAVAMVARWYAQAESAQVSNILHNGVSIGSTADGKLTLNPGDTIEFVYRRGWPMWSWTTLV